MTGASGAHWQARTLLCAGFENVCILVVRDLHIAKRQAWVSFRIRFDGDLNETGCPNELVLSRINGDRIFTGDRSFLRFHFVTIDMTSMTLLSPPLHGSHIPMNQHRSNWVRLQVSSCRCPHRPVIDCSAGRTVAIVCIVVSFGPHIGSVSNARGARDGKYVARSRVCPEVCGMAPALSK